MDGRIWTTAKASFIEENVTQKFAVLLGHPTLFLFVHCVCSSFSLDLLAGYTVSGCYEVTMLTAAVAIAVRLEPRPTIRVLSA